MLKEGIMQPVSTVSIKGKLFDVDNTVINKKKINLYHGNEELLATFKTDNKGRFDIQIPKSATNENIELLFRLSGKNKIASNSSHKVSDKVTACALLKIPHEKQEVVRTIALNALQIDLGKVKMETAFNEERVSLHYTLDILKAAVPALATGVYANLKTKIHSQERAAAIKEIQEVFNVESIPLTDKNIWNFLTNGICPIYFKLEDDGLLSASFNWDSYTFDKEGLPNVKVYFTDWKGSDAKPTIVKIETQERKKLDLPKGPEDMKPKRLHYPNDVDFEDAKRTLNNSALLMGQTVFHLGWAHVYAARIAQLGYDYLGGTVLEEFLFPHFKYIRKITNNLGKDAIEGVPGILNRSPLSPDGILQALSRGIGALNPFTSSPRLPINENHVFAIDQLKVYNALKKAVDRYIDENWEKISKKDWCKVSAFFKHVHSGSPFYQPWGNGNDKDRWQDSREIGGHPVGYVPQRTKSDKEDHEVRSIPLIADDPKGPKEHDKELIKKFILDFLNRVIFWHSSVHRTQYSESPHFPHAKDVNFSPISLEKSGDTAYGGIKVEDALEQQQIGKTFEDFPVREFSIFDPAFKVHPYIVNALKDLELSFPLEEVMPTTLI